MNFQIQPHKQKRKTYCLIVLKSNFIECHNGVAKVLSSQVQCPIDQEDEPQSGPTLDPWSIPTLE